MILYDSNQSIVYRTVMSYMELRYTSLAMASTEITKIRNQETEIKYEGTEIHQK